MGNKARHKWAITETKQISMRFNHVATGWINFCNKWNLRVWIYNTILDILWLKCYPLKFHTQTFYSPHSLSIKMSNYLYSLYPKQDPKLLTSYKFERTQNCILFSSNKLHMKLSDKLCTELTGDLGNCSKQKFQAVNTSELGVLFIA